MDSLSGFKDFLNRCEKRYKELFPECASEKFRPKGYYDEDLQSYELVRHFLVVEKQLPEESIMHFVDYYYGLIKSSPSKSIRSMCMGDPPPYVVFYEWYRRHRPFFDLENDPEAVVNLAYVIRTDTRRTKTRNEFRQRFGSGHIDYSGGRSLELVFRNATRAYGEDGQQSTDQHSEIQRRISE